MEDRLDPRFAEALRSSLLADVRATAPSSERDRGSRPVRPRRRLEPVLAGLVAAVAVLAIVLAGVAVARSHRGADPAGPGVHRPAQPFGGDCTAVASTAALRRLAGARVAPTTADPFGDGIDALPVQLAGGLRCDWAGTTEDESETGLSLVAASADLPGAKTQVYDCYSGSSGGPSQWSCAFDEVDGGTWFSGILTTTAGTSRAEAGDARQRLLAVLAERAPAAGSALPARSRDAWPRIDCAALGDRARLARLLGRPRLTSDEGDGPGPVADAQPAAARWARQTHCTAEDTTAEGASPFIDVRSFPAGAWLAGRVSPFPTPAGARVRFSVRTQRSEVGGPDVVVLWAFDGVNALQLQGSHVSAARLRQAATALLRVLDAAR